MANTLDARTKTAIAGGAILESGELYPHATVFGATQNSWNAATVYRLNTDEVPNTSKDMSEMYKWTYGKKLYGTHAKENVGGKVQRKAINAVYGREADYYGNVVYIDTLRTDKTIGERLRKGDI